MRGMRRKNKLEYKFTVEGQTECQYLNWLQNTINNCQDKFTVKISVQVDLYTTAEIKSMSSFSSMTITHLCDIEGKEEMYKKRFQKIIDQLANINRLGKNIEYQLGYSNLSFELWMILHKCNYAKSVVNCNAYLDEINKCFNKKFESLNKYKREENFKQCLDQLNINDVCTAIKRSKQLMKEKIDKKVEYKKFEYYENNPSLTIWEQIEKIIKDCEVSC